MLDISVLTYRDNSLYINKKNFSQVFISKENDVFSSANIEDIKKILNTSLVFYSGDINTDLFSNEFISIEDFTAGFIFGRRGIDGLIKSKKFPDNIIGELERSGFATPQGGQGVLMFSIVDNIFQLSSRHPDNPRDIVMDSMAQSQIYNGRGTQTFGKLNEHYI